MFNYWYKDSKYSDEWHCIRNHTKSNLNWIINGYGTMFAFIEWI